MKILSIGKHFSSKFNKYFNSNKITVIHTDDIESSNLDINYDLFLISEDYVINTDTSQDIENIKKIVDTINEKYNEPIIFTRSNLLPGTNNKLGTYYFPNFFSESSTLDDFKNNNYWLIGIDNNNSNIDNIKFKIQQFFTLAKDDNCISSDTVQFLDLDIVEYYKFVTNSFISNQISYFNEISKFSKLLNIDYNIIKETINIDNRFSTLYNNVPGRDGYNGFGGNHLMKDLLVFNSFTKQNNFKNYIIHSILDRNINEDRTQMDWLPSNINNKQKYDTFTLTQLNEYCIQNNIDISDCIERTHIIDKINLFDIKKLFNIDTTLHNNNTQNNTTNSFVTQNSGTNKTPYVPKQSGIPMQINQPQMNQSQQRNFNTQANNPFNMSVRNNGNGMFMNMRPSNAPRSGNGGGSVRFGGGGVQTRMR